MSPAPLIALEEIDFVKQYLLLPILLKFLEKDIETIQNLKLYMSLVYVTNFKFAQREAIKEMNLLGKQMRIRGIKIISQQQFHEGLHAEYLCRGYQHEMTLLWSFIKAQVAIKLSEYLKVNLADGD